MVIAGFLKHQPVCGIPYVGTKRDLRLEVLTLTKQDPPKCSMGLESLLNIDPNSGPNGALFCLGFKGESPVGSKKRPLISAMFPF